jgi:tetratricopeptide (TPR) repeat protein
MSREQLDRAYSLIKNGQLQEAISIIEAVIRADRDNENAWWLLANATTELAAKRNALNNVLRLTQNSQRADKARSILQAINDPYDFDDKPNRQNNMPVYQSVEQAKQRKAGSGCGRIVIGTMVIIGLCACVSVAGLFWVARPIFDAVKIPASYNNQGIIQDTFGGSISADAPIDGFVYRGVAGERMTITVDSANELAPFIFVYDTSTGLVANFAQATAPNSPTQLSLELPGSGEYLITVHGITFLGQDFGYGEYSMTFEVR